MSGVAPQSRIRVMERSHVGSLVLTRGTSFGTPRLLRRDRS
jgi:hypothetical protein